MYAGRRVVFIYNDFLNHLFEKLAFLPLTYEHLFNFLYTDFVFLNQLQQKLVQNIFV